MGFLRKKTDPISARSKALNAEIASLEAEIRKLDQKLQQQSAVAPEPRPAPYGRHPPNAAARSAPAVAKEPVFEQVDRHPLHVSAAPEQSPNHYNDLGVRKYDLAAAWQRLRALFKGPPTTNPKLVTYLAAGSIRGLRPLRYEKRVARNRFIALLLILVFLVWGVISLFVRTR